MFATFAVFFVCNFLSVRADVGTVGLQYGTGWKLYDSNWDNYNVRHGSRVQSNGSTYAIATGQVRVGTSYSAPAISKSPPAGNSPAVTSYHTQSKSDLYWQSHEHIFLSGITQ